MDEILSSIAIDTLRRDTLRRDLIAFFSVNIGLSYATLPMLMSSIVLIYTHRIRSSPSDDTTIIWRQSVERLVSSYHQRQQVPLQSTQTDNPTFTTLAAQEGTSSNSENNETPNETISDVTLPTGIRPTESRGTTTDNSLSCSATTEESAGVPSMLRETRILDGDPPKEANGKMSETSSLMQDVVKSNRET